LNVTAKPLKGLKGEIKIPGDKSISHRAAMIGSISNGITVARNFLMGEDCLCTVKAMQSMGIDIEVDRSKVTIYGKGLKGLEAPKEDIYLGNSGTSMRLMAGILAGQNFSSVLTGDNSLSKRPMKRIVDPLKKMGANIRTRGSDFYAPIKIQGGKLKAISYRTPVASAQVKSCILLAGLYAEGTTQVVEPYISRDHTERMLSFFGAEVKRDGLTAAVSPGRDLRSKEFYVPSDISSAAFFIVLALITRDSEIFMRSVGMNPTRSKILDVLTRMGGSITVKRNNDEGLEPTCELKVKSSGLKATVIKREEIAQLIDEIPIICVAASRAEGVTAIKGVEELRVKETDRIHSIVDNLSRMGVDIKAAGNDLVINGSKKDLNACMLESYGDHRTAMSMAVASGVAKAECKIKDVDCVDTSFPGFFETLKGLG